MIEFETQLKKLKHLVLKQVVILAKENRLDNEELEKIPYEIIKGDRPQYRCCVYKERAIVTERVKLAIGCLPNGTKNEPLIDIQDNDQIIYVIPAACDRCPINRFTVTEACRGCLAHKCLEVCPAKAITKIAGRAYINQELCKECGMCKKVCPYDAISEVMRPCKKVCPTGALDVNERDRKAVIKSEDCINCGICMSSCPFGAISDKSYIIPVAQKLLKNMSMYAIIAPSIAGQFGANISVGQIKSALLKLGFNHVLEAACGADTVTIHEAKEFLERMESGEKYMTNSCCAGLVGFIEKKFPTEVSKISNTVSPMIAAARMIRKIDGNATIVFIGPCTAKKAEIKKDSFRNDINYVLTFEEIAAMLDAFEIDVENCEECTINDASLYGRNFAQAGGLVSAIDSYVKEIHTDITFNPVNVSGADDLKKVMIMAKAGKPAGNFIEGMLCSEGCIGGAGTMVPYVKSKLSLNKFSNSSPIKSVTSNEKLNNYSNLNLEK